jgi:hypothetical protein
MILVLKIEHRFHQLHARGSVLFKLIKNVWNNRRYNAQLIFKN